MKALILAAGQGTRLRHLTDQIPKPMVPLNGKPLLIHQLEILHKHGINDINIVGGFCIEHLPEGPYKVFANPHYAETNMVYSMFQAADVFRSGQDVLIIYGDILFGDAALKSMIEGPDNIVLGVNTQWRQLWEARFEDPLSDAESMILKGDNVIELGRKSISLDEIQGQFTGLIKFSGAMAQSIWKQWGVQSLDNPDASSVQKMYMTDFLQNLIDTGEQVSAALIHGDWLEVDSVEDLELYETLISTGQLSSICSLDTITKTKDKK